MIALPIADVIVAYLESALPGQALSLEQSVRQIRGMAAHCELTDRELAEIVASHAVAMGVPAILFDLDRSEADERDPLGEAAVIGPGSPSIAPATTSVVFFIPKSRPALDVSNGRSRVRSNLRPAERV
jgi:hypothetical protein